MTKRIRNTVLAAALCAGFGASCIGPNNAFESVHHWNMEASDSKWVQEAIFIGFNIIPVYSFAYLADIVIFNSLEFWTGDNPINTPPPHHGEEMVELGA